MQGSPIEKINKQFEILMDWKSDFLIKEYIPPKIEARKILYRNDVVQELGERSLKAQKYFNYCQQYMAFFKSKSYQFLFNDYSLGRFVYNFDENNHLISYNLYWNPCPFSQEFIKEIEDSEFDVCEYIDNMELQEKIELKNIVLRTPIRIDYDKNYSGTNKNYHPLLHFHYQDKNTRAKSSKVFSLYAYILFVLENCYPDIYQNVQFEEKITLLRKLDEETAPWLKIKPNIESQHCGKEISTTIHFS